MVKIKKIKGFKDYSITDTGKVLSERHGGFKWLKLEKRKDGYLQVTLSKNGKSYNKRVHRLVAEAFIPNPENKPCIDHINGVRDDNRIENLRYCTYKENNSFPLAKKNKSETHQGEKNPMYGKPRPEGAGKPPKEVVQFTKNGEFVAEYASVMDAERQTKVNSGNICKCCRGKINSAGGFKWKYAA